MDPILTQRVREMARDATVRQLTRKPTPQLEPPANDQLGEIAAPTLVVAGDCDVSYIQQVVDRLVAAIPGAQKHVFPNAAHLVNLEHPRVFNQMVLSFLEAHPFG
jgi:pimeloyl-ACP methyl ester carboxylesterase